MTQEDSDLVPCQQGAEPNHRPLLCLGSCTVIAVPPVAITPHTYPPPLQVLFGALRSGCLERPYFDARGRTHLLSRIRSSENLPSTTFVNEG